MRDLNYEWKSTTTLIVLGCGEINPICADAEIFIVD